MLQSLPLKMAACIIYTQSTTSLCGSPPLLQMLKRQVHEWSPSLLWLSKRLLCVGNSAGEFWIVLNKGRSLLFAKNYDVHTVNACRGNACISHLACSDSSRVYFPSSLEKPILTSGVVQDKRLFKLCLANAWQGIAPISRVMLGHSHIVADCSEASNLGDGSLTLTKPCSQAVRERYSLATCQFKLYTDVMSWQLLYSICDNCSSNQL